MLVKMTEFPEEKKIKCSNCENYVKLIVRETTDVTTILCARCAMEGMEDGGDD